MSGQTMTMREIADLCEVDRTTVVRWIAKIENCALRTEIGAKCTEADEAKKSARFELREVLAIINAGGKHTMAALLADNAKALPAPSLADPALIAAIVRETVRALLPEMRALLAPAPKAITYTHRAITSTYSPLIPFSEGQARLSRQAMPICASRAGQVLEVSNNRIARQAQRMGIGSGHAYTREQILSIWGGIYARHVLAVKGPETYREADARKLLAEVRA